MSRRDFCLCFLLFAARIKMSMSKKPFLLILFAFFSLPLAGAAQESIPLATNVEPAGWSGTGVFIKNIRFQGNVSIPTDVLLQMMDLRTNTMLEYGEVRAAVARVTSFYSRQGYTMTHAEGVHIGLDGVLEIGFDEGYIERIRILNRNIYSIYGFKKELQIREGEIFNKIVIEQELERIRRKSGLKEIKYHVLPNPSIPSRYDLYIQSEGYKGRSFGFLLDNEEFMIVPRLTFKDYDFWGLDHEIAISVETKISWLDLKRRKVGVDYYIPSIFGDVVRPFLHFEKTHEKKSRGDIAVKYWEDNTIFGLFTENRIGPGFIFRTGLVHNAYSLFDLDSDPALTPPGVASSAYENLGYAKAQFSIEYRHTEDRFRRDKHFYASLNVDYLLKEKEADFFMTVLRVRKTFQRKLDDIMLQYTELHIFAEPGFYHDLDVVDYKMRGYSGSELMTRHAFIFSGEYRLSVYHDVIKLCFFSDSAIYRTIDHAQGGKNGDFVYKLAIGQGLEFNLYEWSIKFYYALPYNSPVLKGHGHLKIEKVF